MHDLNDIHAFIETVREGSFSRAAGRLGVQKSTLSRRVSALEKRLGAQLLQRTTRKLALTQAGERYFERVSRMFVELEALDRETTESQSAMRGKIRVTAPVVFGDSYLTPILARFVVGHPEVEFDLVYDDRVVDMIGERFDLALRAGDLEDSSLRAKKLGTGEFAFYASPDYLERGKKLQSPRDLERGHSCIVYVPADSHFPWHLTHKDGRRARVRPPQNLRVNTLQAAMELARTGAGVALLPTFLAKDSLISGELVPVLKDWTTARTAYHMVTPPRRYESPALKAFMKFLASELKI